MKTTTRTPFTPRQRKCRRHVRIGWCLLIAGIVAILAVMIPSTARGQEPATGAVTVYGDGLESGFLDLSWSGSDVNFDAAENVLSGVAAMRVQLQPYSAVSLRHPEGIADRADGQLTFAANAGANAALTLLVAALDDELRPGAVVPISVPAGAWQNVAIPVSDLGVGGSIHGLWWQEADGKNTEPFYLDEVQLIPVPAPEPTPEPTPTPTGAWALEETFDGDPTAPSQDLLPDNFDYAVTHRSHPGDHFEPYPLFPADHGDNCAGPNPDIVPLPQHVVETRQDSDGADPDDSFFICKNHMMSSMGQAGPYSVSAFWPRQEFNFAGGGVLEFEVNINDAHDVRSWWEIMIVPRDQLKVAAGPVDSPISETYPDDRIVLDFRRNVRTIKVGTGALAPDGWLANDTQRGMWDWAWWRDLHPEDPALDDRRIRRTMRVELQADQIVWGIETDDGTFDEWSVPVPGGLPFEQGLVLFKTHAYNPVKDGNTDTYTFHWDNIRFDGPVVGNYQAHQASDVVYLQRNGDRTVGESETVTVNLSDIGDNPVLFGQIHQPKKGHVLLSINGGPDIAVEPYEFDRPDCASDHWTSFRLELDPADLQLGENELTWTIGPKPDCANGPIDWNGFSVKFLQIQTE